jgi:protein SCO1
VPVVSEGLKARALWGVALAALVGCAQPRPTSPVERGPVALLDEPWVWTDEQGVSVSLGAWKGGPLVVTAFFTTCNTRCPLTVEKLHALDAALQKKGIVGTFALVTLDPQSDSVDRLRRFKESHGLPPSWHMLTAGLEQTRALARSLGLRAMYDDGHIDHDVRIAVFDSTGRLVRNFAGWDFDENAVLGRAP